MGPRFLFLVFLLFLVLSRCGLGQDTPSLVRCIDPPSDPSNPTSSLKCPDPLTFAFRFTGAEQTFTVPEDCGFPPPPTPEGEEAPPPTPPPTQCFFNVEACGASGKSWGGKGGYIASTIVVAPGSSVYAYVGGMSSTFNGGGSAVNGGGQPVNGGGATDLRTEMGDLHSRLVVAGAGGSGGNCDPRCPGGDGGGFFGGAGKMPNKNPKVRPNGGGGTQTQGGRCGTGWTTGKTSATGQFGRGGSNTVGGGAGGGGYYGGGAGGFGWGTGGGGSSYSAVPPFASLQAMTRGDGRCYGNGVLYLTPIKLEELPPVGIEAPPAPTPDPTLEPTDHPTRRPVRTPPKKPTKTVRKKRPTYPHP